MVLLFVFFVAFFVQATFREGSCGSVGACDGRPFVREMRTYTNKLRPEFSVLYFMIFGG